MMSVVKDVKKFLNKLNKMKLKNKVLLGVLILVSAIVLHYVYNRVPLLQNIVSKLRVLNPLHLMEKYSSGDKFVFFSMEGCGHCDAVHTSGEFENLKKNYTDIDCVEDGSKSPDPSLAEHRKNVQGYPTFMLIKSGKAIAHDGPRTESAFTQFLSQHK